MESAQEAVSLTQCEEKEHADGRGEMPMFVIKKALALDDIGHILKPADVPHNLIPVELYNLEPHADPEVSLNLDLGLYQMEPKNT